MSAIIAEPQGVTHEMVELLSPEHDPIGSAKCIHLTVTDRSWELTPAGSFAADTDLR